MSMIFKSSTGTMIKVPISTEGVVGNKKADAIHKVSITTITTTMIIVTTSTTSITTSTTSITTTSTTTSNAYTNITM